MSKQFLTTEELTALFIANYEKALNQTVPAGDKSFVKVQSGIEAITGTSLFRYAKSATKQSLALTATGTDLDLIGSNYKLPRKNAVSTVLTATLPGIDPTVVTAGTDFTGNDNGERYKTTGDATTSAGLASITLTANTPGVAGNLGDNRPLTIGTQIPGMETVATITSTTTTGANSETDDKYRIRILDKIRSEGGGANTADYRGWGQEVEGVDRIYPYSGRPVDNPTAPSPARTLYVESSSSIDPDGIAPGSLLNQVREAVTTNPDTGIARQPLGITNDTLFVQSIIRTGFYVEIRGLDVPSGDIAGVKSDIESALTLYFKTIEPFVSGLDPVFSQNDTITDGSISAIVQDALSANGASVTGVGFGTAPSVFLSRYNLSSGEEAKLAASPTYI